MSIILQNILTFANHCFIINKDISVKNIRKSRKNLRSICNLFKTHEVLLLKAGFMETISLTTRESFDAVMRMYTPTVYGIAYTRLGNPADAEDVSQNVFIRYFKADITYESEEHRKAWLIRCAVNCTISYATSSHYRHRAADTSLDELHESAEQLGSDVEERSEKAEQRRAVLDAVMKLPAKYRTVVHLFYFEDMSIAQISEATGARQSTVKSQLSRARDKLRKLLAEEVEF